MTKNVTLTNSSMDNLIASQERLKTFLPALKPKTAESLSLMFSLPRTSKVTCQNETSQWFFSFAGLSDSIMKEWVLLETNDTRIFLNFTVDQWPTAIGTRPWHDYQGESQLLAWNLAHEYFLQHLSKLFNIPLRATSLAEHSGPEPQDNVVLDWTVKMADNNASGQLVVSSSLLSDCLASDCWMIDDNISPSLRHNFSLAIQIQFQSQDFTLEELMAFQIGDIMLIDRADRCWHNLLLCSGTGRSLWHAVYNSGQLTLKEPDSYTLPRQETIMQEELDSTQIDEQTTSHQEQETDINSITATDTQLSSSLLNSLPINVTFQIGELHLSLKELQNIQPGFVFDLQQPLEKAYTSIFANGQCIGKGDLVMVGETLGICLTSLDSSGIE